MPKVNAKNFKFLDYTIFNNIYLIEDESDSHRFIRHAAFAHQRDHNGNSLAAALKKHLTICKIAAGVCGKPKSATGRHRHIIFDCDGSAPLEDTSDIITLSAGSLKSPKLIGYIKGDEWALSGYNIDKAASATKMIMRWLVDTNSKAVKDLESHNDSVLIATVGDFLSNTKYVNRPIYAIPFKRHDSVKVCNKCGAILTSDFHHVTADSNICRKDIAAFATPDDDTVKFNFAPSRVREEIFAALKDVCEFNIDHLGEITVSKWVKVAYETWKSMLQSTMSLSEYLTIVAKDHTN
jgi:hypothetical protein